MAPESGGLAVGMCGRAAVGQYQHIVVALGREALQLGEAVGVVNAEVGDADLEVVDVGFVACRGGEGVESGARSQGGYAKDEAPDFGGEARHGRKDRPVSSVS